MILLMPRFLSCSDRSLVLGLNTLWGLETTTLSCSMSGFRVASQSAPEPSNPPTGSAPLRSTIFMACIILSMEPVDCEPVLVG